MISVKNVYKRFGDIAVLNGVSCNIKQGEKVVINWNTFNNGGYALSGSWTDGIYLSTDTRWDINDIKEWLGHADISTTANIYAHISHRRKVSLAKSLEGSLTFEQSSETTA